jgi:hypothetical protein
MLDAASAWSQLENEDFDGNPKSYDIVALLTGKPLNGLTHG